MFKKTSSKNKHSGGKIKKIIFWTASLIILIMASLALLGLAVFFYFAKDLPRPEDFTEQTIARSTQIYDRTGDVLLYELYGDQKRETVPLSAVADTMKKAVISVEDAKFYTHFGLDFTGILRSIKNNIETGKLLQSGGSTISQQLIRSTFLSSQKTIGRKVKEIILTLELERRYSKDQILEWYLNQVPFGPNIYGVETASKTYFNKSAKDLTLPESALLAALIQAPSYYDPYGSHRTELLARKDYALDRMAEENYITKAEVEAAKKQEIVFFDNTQNIKAPHFVFYVQDYLFQKYGQDFLDQNGLKIYTTLDWDLQQKAEKIVADNAKANIAQNAGNAGLVAIDPKTGEVLSMVGSADWFGKPYPANCVSGQTCIFDPKVNVTTFGNGRQPGSSFKPFVYATAFEKRSDDNKILYDDKTTVMDEQTDFGVWGGEHYIPQDYDGRFRGQVTFREALAESLNIPAIKVLLDYAGLKDSIDNAKKFGITTLGDSSSYGPAIVLGGGEVRLVDMVSAYGVFATEGMRTPAVSVLKIEDSNGNIIEENSKSPRRVLDANSADLINSILSDNDARAPMFGAKSQLYFPDYQVAVKTGTTNDYRDAWCIGYTPSIVAGVWVGNNDNEPINKRTGAMIAAPIWHQFMAEALSKIPKENFNPPENSSPTVSPSPTPSSTPLP